MGALFALIALGYTLVYGIIELVNFAHGDVFMLGCVATLFISRISMPKWALLILLLVMVPIICMTINVLVNRIVYKPLRSAPRLVPLVSALGVSFVLVNVGQLCIGTAPEAYQTNVLSTERGGERGLISREDLLVLLVVIPAMIGLAFLVKFTKIGKAMRATAQNPTAAKLMGINVERVIALTFALGGLFAGLAAVIYTIKIQTVEYQMGYKNGLYAFTAAVVGGIGSIPGSVLGGVLIGLIYSFGQVYLGGAWVDAGIFAALILLLVFKPSGILGTRFREKV